MSTKPISQNPPRWKPNPEPASIVIPGLDTEASTIDQIEQIEQLITIKLQNIDENFSKIHNVLANRLLPAVKRYAVGTEPVREAAKFWTSFYEQAAQIRIPTFDDHSTVNELPSERDDNVSSQEQTTTEEHPGDRTERPQEVFETTVSSETSFMPGQGAVSSTPTTARIPNPQESFASQSSEDPSWTQSPLVKLSQELKTFSLQSEAQLHTFASAVDSIDDHSSIDSDTDDDSFDGLPPGMSPPVLMSPVRPPRSSAQLGLLRLRQTPVKEASERIQRDLLRSALKSVHKSGTKGGHQIRNRDRNHDVIDSSMSTVPTPPSLSRYARQGDYSSTSSSMTKDSSLESMIRHIKQDIQSTSASAPYDAVPGLRLRPKMEQPLGNRGVSPSSFAGPSHPTTPMYGGLAHRQPDHSLDSDSDSLEINNTAHPSAAFLMASRGAPVYDDGDSFGSSNHSSDSLENEDVNALGAGIVPIHPFATNAAVVDDGFYDDDDDSSDGFEDGPAGALGGGEGIINDFEEETVFGSVPAQRQSTTYDRQNIRMLGEDLLQDTIGIGAQIAASGRVEESPTPANWGR